MGYVDGGRVRTGGEVFKKILTTVDEYLAQLRKSTRRGEAVLNASAARLEQNRLTFEASGCYCFVNFAIFESYSYSKFTVIAMNQSPISEHLRVGHCQEDSFGVPMLEFVNFSGSDC